MNCCEPGRPAITWTIILLFAWSWIAASAIESHAVITASGNVTPAYPGGSPDPWHVGDELIVADGSDGSLSIAGGSNVLSAGGTQGFSPLTTGIVAVSGTGSTWINSSDLVLGVIGNGTLNVLSGGRVENQDASVGHLGGTGKVLVRGGGSQWFNASNLIVGNVGNGEVRIEEQGLVSGGMTIIGLDEEAIGAIVVDGQQSRLQVTSLQLGTETDSGAAVVTLSGVGSRAYVGAAAVAQNSLLPISETALVVSAIGGNADVTIYQGNQLTNSGSAYIGIGAGESGSMLVHGASSSWNNGGNVFIGVDGSGHLALVDGGQVSSGGTISIGLNGELSGKGSVTGVLENSGAVAPSRGVGALSVSGAYTQTASGELRIELAGTAPHEFSNLTSSGNATLAGTLTVDLGLNSGNPFDPQMGDLFSILTSASSVLGSFAAADLPTLSAGKMWRLRYTPTSVNLIVTLAGDYNDNGVVDAADFTVWRNLFGTTSDPRADGDTNGIVDIADYNIWKANFGAVAGAGATNQLPATNVPEPTSGASLLTMLAILSAGIPARR